MGKRRRLGHRHAEQRPYHAATLGCNEPGALYAARSNVRPAARFFHGVDSAVIVRRLVKTDARVIGLLPAVDRPLRCCQCC